MLFSALKAAIPAVGGLFTETGFPATRRLAAMPPATVTERTVKSLLETPAYGQSFRLSGQIVRFLGANRYLFSDGTGEIVTRISRPVFGDTSLFKTSKIVIEGELKRTVSGYHILRAQTLRVLYF